MIHVLTQVARSLLSYTQFFLIKAYQRCFSSRVLNQVTVFLFWYKSFYRQVFEVFLLFHSSSLAKLNFLPIFYFRNNLLWADGFLIDFLQKKTIDLLTRKFFLFTGFLFSERFIFEIILKLYLDTLI